MPPVKAVSGEKLEISMLKPELDTSRSSTLCGINTPIAPPTYISAYADWLIIIDRENIGANKYITSFLNII
jgi:hypothetical protein